MACALRRMYNPFHVWPNVGPHRAISRLYCGTTAVGGARVERLPDCALEARDVIVLPQCDYEYGRRARRRWVCVLVLVGLTCVTSIFCICICICICIFSASRMWRQRVGGTQEFSRSCTTRTSSLFGARSRCLLAQKMRVACTAGIL